MTEARKLLAKANALLEEQPRSRSHQDRALALYRRALDFQDSRLVWRNVGIVHFNREEWPEAETAFLRSRDHYWLGLLYEWTGRLEKAWQEIRQAEPSSEQARVQARIARQLGLAADAIPALKYMLHLAGYCEAEAAVPMQQPDPANKKAIYLAFEPLIEKYQLQISLNAAEGVPAGIKD